MGSERTIGVTKEGRILELAWSTDTNNEGLIHPTTMRAHTHIHNIVVAQYNALYNTYTRHVLLVPRSSVPSKFQCQFLLLLFPSDGGTTFVHTDEGTNDRSINHSKQASKPCHA